MKNRDFLLGSILLISFLMGSAVPVQAQHSVKDSLCKVSFPSCIQDGVHTLKWAEVAIPVTLVGISALYVENECLKKQRFEVQNVLLWGVKPNGEVG